MALDASSAGVPVTLANRSIETPSGIGLVTELRAGSGSTRSITLPMPMSRKPLASSRLTRSAGESKSGVAQMCGVRPIDANSTRTSVRRLSNAWGSSGQRSPSRRFQNGSRSTGSWSRIESPRSRSRDPGWRARAPRAGAAGASWRRRSGRGWLRFGGQLFRHRRHLAVTKRACDRGVPAALCVEVEACSSSRSRSARCWRSRPADRVVAPPRLADRGQPDRAPQASRASGAGCQRIVGALGERIARASRSAARATMRASSRSRSRTSSSSRHRTRRSSATSSPPATPASSDTTDDGRVGLRDRILQTGESDGLVFSTPGTYAFGWTVDPWMTGTFTIAP